MKRQVGSRGTFEYLFQLLCRNFEFLSSVLTELLSSCFFSVDKLFLFSVDGTLTFLFQLSCRNFEFLFSVLDGTLSSCFLLLNMLKLMVV